MAGADAREVLRVVRGRPDETELAALAALLTVLALRRAQAGSEERAPKVPRAGWDRRPIDARAVGAGSWRG